MSSQQVFKQNFICMSREQKHTQHNTIESKVENCHGKLFAALLLLYFSLFIIQ